MIGPTTTTMLPRWRIDDPLSPISIPIDESLAAYRDAVLFFGGFTQRRTDTNGVFGCQEWAYRMYAGPETWVQYFDWYSNIHELADRLAIMAAKTDAQRGRRLGIVIVGYSFGGWTATLLSRALRDRDVDVDVLILCDPVARWFNRFGWTRALLNSTIRVPDNVRLLDGVRQLNPRFRCEKPFLFPKGDRVVVDDAARTEFHGLQVLPDEHADIENSLPFRQIVSAAVSGTIYRQGD